MQSVEGTNYWLEPRLHENKLSVSFDVYDSDLQERYKVGEGNLKWDGCLDLSLGEGTMLHFCDRDSVVEQLRLLVQAIYAMGSMMKK